MNKKVRDQIMKVRDTALINMLDFAGVQNVANELGFYELVTYIAEHPEEYGNFILTGEESPA